MTTRTAITLLNNAETAELLGVKPNTLEIWRTKGTGLPQGRPLCSLCGIRCSRMAGRADPHQHQPVSNAPKPRTAGAAMRDGMNDHSTSKTLVVTDLTQYSRRSCASQYGTQ